MGMPRGHLPVLSAVPCLLLLLLSLPFSYSLHLSQYAESVSSYKYNEEFLDGMPVDHFSFGNNATFKLRYFINTTHFQCAKPILFYTGNEGSLEGFAENTGLMWDLAPELQAAVVFAEHRFYGKTKPFGNDSYKSTDHLQYLSSTQALADFAVLIRHLKDKRIKCSADSPVIAFGGSYGGMLAAWIRIKYPHLVQGAIAASAPVFWFEDSGIQEDIYQEIVTRTFTHGGCDPKAIIRGWEALKNLAATDNGRSFLNSLFKLEEKSKLTKAEDHQFLRAFVREVFESMAMVDYPYPTSFLSPLPGWPVNVGCQHLSSIAKTDEEAANALFQLVNLYYNYTGKTYSLCANAAVCEGAFAALGDPLGWPWQACTEMAMPLCAKGPPTDFFWPECPYKHETAINQCMNTFGSIGFTPGLFRPQWVTTHFGAKSFPSATNIVFSNGYLDPWSGGGWAMNNTKKAGGSLVSVILQKGAHHYDLRGEHPNDTREVKAVRKLEKQHIIKWIAQHQHSRR